MRKKSRLPQSDRNPLLTYPSKPSTLKEEQSWEAWGFPQPHRVPVVQRPRTPPFQGENTGSNPVGDANHINDLAGSPDSLRFVVTLW